MRDRERAWQAQVEENARKGQQQQEQPPPKEPKKREEKPTP